MELSKASGYLLGRGLLRVREHDRVQGVLSGALRDLARIRVSDVLRHLCQRCLYAVSEVNYLHSNLM